MESPQAVILAGGLATRMRPMTESIPKAMIEIEGRPFLAYQLERLALESIRDVVLCVGHLGERIRRRFGDGRDFGVRLRYSEDGPRLMGTAGALKKAEPLLGERFFMLDGDAFLQVGYGELRDFFERREALAAMVVYDNKDKHASSNVVLHGERVAAYERTRAIPGLDYAHAGLSLLKKEALSLIPADRPSAQDELWPQLAAHGELFALRTHKRFYDIGTPRGLEEFRRFLAKPG